MSLHRITQSRAHAEIKAEERAIRAAINRVLNLPEVVTLPNSDGLRHEIANSGLLTNLRILAERVGDAAEGGAR